MSDMPMGFMGPMDPTVPLMDRLRRLVGQQVTVYVMSTQLTTTGTMAVTGMLHAVGMDYIELHVTAAGGSMRPVLVPLVAVSAIVVGAPSAGIPVPTPGIPVGSPAIPLGGI